MNPVALTAAQCDAINTLAYWLAPDDVSVQRARLHADLIVLAGHAVLPNIEGAFSLAREHNLPLLISGGIGHSTTLLAQAISAHSRYRNLPTDGLSEAAMLAAIAREFFAIPPEQLLLEEASTNGGQNAAFSWQLLQEKQLPARRIVLVQDPLMQRRCYATFRHHWQQQGTAATFLNWPVFVPQLQWAQGLARFSDVLGEGLWSFDRFLSLLLGEIPRLRDDCEGYGPQGKNFIEHVDIPPAVEQAFALLKDSDLLAGVSARHW
ncbi:YdcF family protein [Erwinia sp. V71]|uniref:YdcF family protein n=1 Tax=Erwinia sp. V71 TaxID=3369424 RepID=UPI003F5DB47E